MPIIIDKNNVIVAGHTRLKAAQKLGLEEVPVIIADDLTDDQVKAFRLADNKVGELAEWDFSKLEEELKNIEMDMSAFDFDMKELSKEFDKNKEVVEDDFDVDEAFEQIDEPVTQRGDVWLLGNHRLMCGDSTSKDDVETLMNGVKTEMSFTSPPYNIGVQTAMKTNIKYKNYSDNKSQTDYCNFLKQFSKNAIENSEYSFVNIQSLSGNKIALINYLYDLQNYYADTIIWNKVFSQPAMGENILNSSFEYIHIFSEYATRRIGTKSFRGTLSNVLEQPPQRNNEFSNIHNATFSIQFVSYFIENFTNENESVLDLFGGTGTTLIACEQLDRKCYMMELDPKYCDVIIQRWEALTGKKATLEGVE